MYKIKSKRGVSPLIATLILIVFAITLGSVVINWGFNIEFANGGPGCKDVEFRTRNVGGSEICITQVNNHQVINFVIDNLGDIEIYGLDLWMIGSEGNKLINLDKLNIPPNTIYFYNYTDAIYENNNYGDLNQVQITPKIKTDKIESCTNKIINSKRIGLCDI
tara:strand:+ start:798 stop:1286 length:489 start_codon:yes stop_codon:yes gene_type:complete